MNARETLQSAKSKINELWPDSSDSQQEQPQQGPPKNPKAGETWETEKGVIVVLIPSAFGALSDDETGKALWRSDGSVTVPGGNTERDFGALVRKISDAPSKQDAESESPEATQDSPAQDPPEEKPAKKKRARKAKKNDVVTGAASPGSEVVDDTPKILFEGCYGTARNGEVIGPFRHVSSLSQWPWEADYNGDRISWKPDGTFYEEGREDPLDIVKIHKTRPE